MDIIGGREKRKRNKKWILEEGRKKERKEGGMEGGREGKKEKKQERRQERRALQAREAHTGLRGSGHAWPWLPHPPVSPAHGPSAVDMGVLTWGPPARLQDFESLFLILLCRISLLVVDFLP